jgi:hypothetical protein
MHPTRKIPKTESKRNERVEIFFEEHKAAQAIICSVKVPNRSVKKLLINLINKETKKSNKFSEKEKVK